MARSSSRPALLVISGVCHGGGGGSVASRRSGPGFWRPLEPGTIDGTGESSGHPSSPAVTAGEHPTRKRPRMFAAFLVPLIHGGRGRNRTADTGIFNLLRCSFYSIT